MSDSDVVNISACMYFKVFVCFFVLLKKDRVIKKIEFTATTAMNKNILLYSSEKSYFSIKNGSRVT